MKKKVVSRRPAEPQTPRAGPARAESADPNRPPSRTGKKAVTGFFDPQVSKQLRQIALDHDESVQGLLREALNDLFAKYEKQRIA